MNSIQNFPQTILSKSQLAPRTGLEQVPTGDQSSLGETSEKLQEFQQIEAQLVAAARVNKQSNSLAEKNSIALDQLNHSQPVKELTRFLEERDQQLNLIPLEDHQFYQSSVRLSAEHMRIAGDDWNSVQEGWLTLDSSGIHLIQLKDRIGGEEYYACGWSSSVRPCLPTRLIDQLLGNRDREVLAKVDIQEVEQRIAKAVQDAHTLAENPTAQPSQVISTVLTQRWHNTFDTLES